MNTPHAAVKRCDYRYEAQELAACDSRRQPGVLCPCWNTVELHDVVQRREKREGGRERPVGLVAHACVRWWSSNARPDKGRVAAPFRLVPSCLPRWHTCMFTVVFRDLHI
jgi:hypothetical protein